MERRAVTSVLRSLAARGWMPYRVAGLGPVTTEAETLEHIFSVDESNVFFKHADHPKFGSHVYFVLGNEEDGSTVVCDHSVAPDTTSFASAIKEGVENHQSVIDWATCPHCAVSWGMHSEEELDACRAEGRK